MNTSKSSNVNPFVIPISIVVAGLIIALAIIFSGGNVSGSVTNSDGSTGGGNSFGNTNSASAESLRPISEDDHIKGAVNAKVTIVEYSDYECPFCRRLHPTLSRIVDEFPEDVAWVYRHFPLTSIHSRAQGASVASECVTELAGNDAFWEFSDKIFDNQGSLGDSLYTEIAGSLGIDVGAFNECLNSDRHSGKVTADRENAIASGARGTPFSVVVTAEGEVFPFSGALPYEQVRQIVESALSS